MQYRYYHAVPVLSTVLLDELARDERLHRAPSRPLQHTPSTASHATSSYDYDRMMKAAMIVALACATNVAAQSSCAEDVNGDGSVE